MSVTKTELEARLQKIVDDYVCKGYIDWDLEELAEKFYRLGYAEGYNSAARQFGTGNIEFFKGDIK